jgi:hypothetical protein
MCDAAFTQPSLCARVSHRNGEPNAIEKMPGIIWWIRQGVLTLIFCFFLLFGIHVLIAAYHLKDPFSFVMTFFASNLIILISMALLAGFIYRMVSTARKIKSNKSNT